ncbi:Leucine-rich repeat [Trinorchestia longiramus]|nr:Leucine-rich repeat [Trinorchestia longiramus]
MEWRGAILTVVWLCIVVGTVSAQCPWRRSVPELTNMCVCVTDEQQKLSIQCTDANFPLLMTTIHKMVRSRQMDLLYVNDTDIGVLNSRIFDGLHIQNIQFSYCRIHNISDQAFVGLESSLENLNLQGNRLKNVPSAALTHLSNLRLLDLSGNHINLVPDGAFGGLQLETLKLGDNDIYLSPNSFQGLEKSLKNLNLKGAGLDSLPASIFSLETLAFLDLAQNEIQTLPPGALRSLHSLTALNLERNLLQALGPDVFVGVNDTLSSLSLLNNLISIYPTEAINSLTDLRVLDIGFNLLEDLPLNAFQNIKSLTLLALDGNQLRTVPLEPFQHLASSLKGLSVGGKFLVCDCRVAWIVEWIQNKDLQVTSRERSPQFCGEPVYFRQRSFYQLSPEQLLCNTSSFTVSSSASVGSTNSAAAPTSNVVSAQDARLASFGPLRPKTTSPVPEVTSYRPGPPVHNMDDQPHRSHAGDGRQDSSLSQDQTLKPTRGEKLSRAGLIRTGDRPSRVPPQQVVHGGVAVSRRPQLVRHPDSIEQHETAQFGAARESLSDEVIIQDAYRKDNSVIIQWDSEVSNILGFRVVYRLFGDKQFKLGPPLASSEREFKIRNVPTQECIVVCVVSLEDINVTPENVPFPQCREIRTEESKATHMDTIIIAASAAICGTVIIALIVFICCNRRRSSRHSTTKDGIPNVIAQSAAPLASLGTLNGGLKADWDTLSMYSQRSIPRARMYHMDKGNINAGFTPDEVQSHLSAASLRPHSRALADGQSARGYAGLSAAHIGPQLASLSLSRPDLRMSRQSLANNQLLGYNNMGPGMMTMNSLTGMNTLSNMGRMPSASHLSRAASTRSRHARSKSRERASSRMSHAGSSHSLTGYDTDGWTDHDMDIYVARNPTRGGLVQL